jgi:hypothetical protein
MAGRWTHLGHQLGECWYNVDKHIIYINIPKNASSFVKGCLMGSKSSWVYYDHMMSADKYLVVLRDPIDRWVSGIAQFMAIESNKNIPLNDLVNNITFDDHTELQTYFLQGVDLDCCEFIRADKNLRTVLKQWLNDNGYVSNVDNVPNLNQGNETEKNKFAILVDDNKQIKLKLAEHYAKDYELINRVKFYGT